MVQLLNRYPLASQLTVTSGMDGNHGPRPYGSHHYGLSYRGSPTAAIDIVCQPGGGVTAYDRACMNRAADWLQRTYGAYSTELIYAGGGGNYVKNQRRSGPYASAGHGDHIHWALSGRYAARFLGR